jgi:5-methylcytosine-specific restriction endonuclease McrA
MSKKRKRKTSRRTANSPGWMVAGSIGKGNRSDYDNWKSRGFYTAASASECKRIDPETGAITVVNVLEEVANDILKTDKKLTKQQGRTRRGRKSEPRNSTHNPSGDEKEAFYKSWEWRKLRMQVIKLQGRVCQCCGAHPSDRDMAGKPVKIVVDHIKPISKCWGLRLKRDNLQVLCDECNQGKGNWDETDFREPEAPDEWVIEGPNVDAAILHQLTDQTSGRLQ